MGYFKFSDLYLHLFRRREHPRLPQDHVCTHMHVHLHNHVVFSGLEQRRDFDL